MALPVTRVVHCRREPYDVYIGRGPGKCDMSNTPVGKRGWLGNPYPKNDPHMIAHFEKDFSARLAADSEFREAVLELRGQRLGCWCAPKGGLTAADVPHICHGQVIAAWLDKHGAKSAGRRRSARGSSE
jgi:hypothetical protein